MDIVNPKITEYLDGLYDSLNPDLKWLREVCERREIPTILRSTERFLVTLLKATRPKDILEIGTAIGYSSSVMATVLPDTNIITVEKYDRSFYDAKEAFERIGLSSRINQVLEDGIDAMSRYSKEGMTFDFIFIDGAKSHYKEFFDLALEIVNSEGIIVCDNVLLKASVADETSEKQKRFKTSITKMQEFLHYISNNKKVDTAVLPIGDGISISYVK